MPIRYYDGSIWKIKRPILAKTQKRISLDLNLSGVETTEEPDKNIITKNPEENDSIKNKTAKENTKGSRSSSIFETTKKISTRTTKTTRTKTTKITRTKTTKVTSTKTTKVIKTIKATRTKTTMAILRISKANTTKMKITTTKKGTTKKWNKTTTKSTGMCNSNKNKTNRSLVKTTKKPLLRTTNTVAKTTKKSTKTTKKPSVKVTMTAFDVNTKKQTTTNTLPERVNETIPENWKSVLKYLVDALVASEARQRSITAYEYTTPASTSPSRYLIDNGRRNLDEVEAIRALLLNGITVSDRPDGAFNYNSDNTVIRKNNHKQNKVMPLDFYILKNLITRENADTKQVENVSNNEDTLKYSKNINALLDKMRSKNLPENKRSMQETYITVRDKDNSQDRDKIILLRAVDDIYDKDASQEKDIPFDWEAIQALVETNVKNTSQGKDINLDLSGMELEKENNNLQGEGIILDSDTIKTLLKINDIDALQDRDVTLDLEAAEAYVIPSNQDNVEDIIEDKDIQRYDNIAENKDLTIDENQKAEKTENSDPKKDTVKDKGAEGNESVNLMELQKERDVSEHRELEGDEDIIEDNFKYLLDDREISVD